MSPEPRSGVRRPPQRPNASQQKEKTRTAKPSQTSPPTEPPGSMVKAEPLLTGWRARKLQQTSAQMDPYSQAPSIPESVTQPNSTSQFETQFMPAWKRRKLGLPDPSPRIPPAISPAITTTQSIPAPEFLVETFATFEEMNLGVNVIGGLRSSHYLSPNLLQQKAIVPILKRRHVLIETADHTGGSIALSIACTQLVLSKLKYTQAVIIAPSIPLVTRLHTVCYSSFSSHSLTFFLLLVVFHQILTTISSSSLPGLSILPLTTEGDSAMPSTAVNPTDQINHIIIGTPSSIQHHLAGLDLRRVELLIISKCHYLNTIPLLDYTRIILESIPPSTQLVFLGFENSLFSCLICLFILQHISLSLSISLYLYRIALQSLISFSA